jgi:hypothetical protein
MRRRTFDFDMESCQSARLSIIERTISELRVLSGIENLWKRPRYADHLKFVCEAIIAFKGGEDPDSQTILQLAGRLICSTDTRCALAVQPSTADYFLGAYVHLPGRLKEQNWNRVFEALAEQFPPIQADLPRYRIEEQAYTRRIAAGTAQAPISLDLDEFLGNAINLSRDQMYAFTHRIFYLTDYCRSSLRVTCENRNHLEEHIRLQAFHCYIVNDIDIFLEYILCYLSLPNSVAEEANFLVVLLGRMLARDDNRRKLFTNLEEFNFTAYYHQAFLFLMVMNHSAFNLEPRSFSLDRYRRYQTRYRFLRELRRLNIVNVFKMVASFDEGGYYRFLLERFSRSLKGSGLLEAETLSRLAEPVRPYSPSGISARAGRARNDPAPARPCSRFTFPA